MPSFANATPITLFCRRLTFLALIGALVLSGAVQNNLAAPAPAGGKDDASSGTGDGNPGDDGGATPLADGVPNAGADGTADGNLDNLAAAVAGASATGGPATNPGNGGAGTGGDGVGAPAGVIGGTSDAGETITGGEGTGGPQPQQSGRDRRWTDRAFAAGCGPEG